MKIGQEVIWEDNLQSSCIDTGGVQKWFGRVISFDEETVCVAVKFINKRDVVVFVKRELIENG